MDELEKKIEEFKDAGGMKITVDSEGVRYEAYEPLTIDDIDDLDCMELEELSKDDLEDLLSKAEDLLDEVEEDEPKDEDEAAAEPETAAEPEAAAEEAPAEESAE